MTTLAMQRCALFGHDWHQGAVQQVTNPDVPGSMVTFRFKTCERCGRIKRRVISVSYDPAVAERAD